MTHDRGVEVALRPARWPYAVGLVAVVALVALVVRDDAASDDAAPAPTPTTPTTDLPVAVETAGDLEWATVVEGAAGRAPVVVGEVVVVATEDGSLVALERDTGARLWRGPAAGPSPTEPVAVGPFVVTASGTSLTAVRAVNGEPAWTYELPGPAPVRPAVAGSRLVVVTEGAVLGLDGHRGALRWEGPLAGGAAVTVAPVADSRTVLVAVGQDVLAFDAASASLVWSRRLDADVAALGVAHGVSFATTADGAVVSSAGWTASVPGPVESEPAASGEIAVFASTGGVVHAIDVDTGRRRWERQASSPVTAPLVARRDVVFVTTDDGLLHRLEPATGRRIATARSGAGARVVTNPGPGPALFTVDATDAVAGVR